MPQERILEISIDVFCVKINIRKVMELLRKKRGMTLIEILVVLAILAAVGAMLARGISTQRAAATRKSQLLEAERIIGIVRMQLIANEDADIVKALGELGNELAGLKLKTTGTTKGELRLVDANDVQVAHISSQEILEGKAVHIDF